MKTMRVAVAAAAALFLSGAAMAAGADYKPAPGVTMGGASGAPAPGGIHPDCAKLTTRADIVDCIKDKERERGKANVTKGKGYK